MVAWQTLKGTLKHHWAQMDFLNEYMNKKAVKCQYYKLNCFAFIHIQQAGASFDRYL